MPALQFNHISKYAPGGVTLTDIDVIVKKFR